MIYTKYEAVSISKFFKLLLDNPSLKEPSNILRKTNVIPLNDVIGVLITHLDYKVDEFFASILYSFFKRC